MAATAVPAAEAEMLLGQGDFLAVIDDTQVHFQAAFIGNYDLHLTLATIHRNRPRPLLAQPLQLNLVGEVKPEEEPIVWQRQQEPPPWDVVDEEPDEERSDDNELMDDIAEDED